MEIDFSDNESIGSFLGTSSRNNNFETKYDHRIDQERDHETRKIAQTFLEMNRQIGEVTTLVKGNLRK